MNQGISFKNLFIHRCGISTFRVQHAAYQAVLGIENSKLRASTYKLYRWVCSQTDRSTVFSTKRQVIEKATGLCEHAIINARNELVRLGLIVVHLEPGPGGGYEFCLLNSQTHVYLEWDHKPWPRYFRVPSVSMLSTIYVDKLSGSDLLVYDQLCQMMGRIGNPDIPIKTGHWFKAVKKTTLRKAEAALERTGFVRLKDGVIEVLHPETSQSMPEKALDEEPWERTYYVDYDTGQRRLFSDEQVTPEIVERYFLKSLPRSADWTPGHNAHCPFHDDQTPSVVYRRRNWQMEVPCVRLRRT